jgi:hypothetical protein
VRTWQDNRTAINQLWPQCQWTDEERRLWSDDLSSLDQDVLYDATRNVKRNNDTLYPQLKWFREEYRSLKRLRDARNPNRPSSEPRPARVDIAAELDERTKADLMLVVEDATVENHREVVDLIAEKAGNLQIRLHTAYRLVSYLLQRLGLDNGGRIWS